MKYTPHHGQDRHTPPKSAGAAYPENVAMKANRRKYRSMSPHLKENMDELVPIDQYQNPSQNPLVLDENGKRKKKNSSRGRSVTRALVNATDQNNAYENKHFTKEVF